MNMRVAKEEMALMMPASLSNYSTTLPFQQDDTSSRRSLGEIVGAVVRWVAELPRRRAMLDELASLSDHELSDIGLNRADLPRVFDPAFAAQRNAGFGSDYAG